MAQKGETVAASRFEHVKRMLEDTRDKHQRLQTVSERMAVALRQAIVEEERRPQPNGALLSMMRSALEPYHG